MMKIIYLAVAVTAILCFMSTVEAASHSTYQWLRSEPTVQAQPEYNSYCGMRSYGRYAWWHPTLSGLHSGSNWWTP